MSLDLDRLRADTPGCTEVLHFNNAGAGLLATPTLDAMTAHLELEARIGGYEAAAANHAGLDRAYGAVAELINARPDEIALVENATRAWDMAFYAIPFVRGDKILTSVAEYASNYIAFLQTVRRIGVEVIPVPDDEHGQLNVAALEELIDDRTKLIAMTYLPTNGGLINPAKEVGRIAKDAGVLYLLDACQAAGQLPLDVKELQCDFLSATGRKYLRGPRGTGFLYVDYDLACELEPPFLDLHAAEWTSAKGYTIQPGARRFETWETNLAARAGLAVAVDYAREVGLEAIRDRIQSLAQNLRGRLAQHPRVVIRDKGQERSGLVTFTVENAKSFTVQQKLREKGINVAVSPESFTRLDMEARGLENVLRASVHYYNTEDEIDRFLTELDETIS